MRQTGLGKVRDEIRSLDEEIVSLVRERMILGITTAHLKSRRNLPILDRRREAEVLDQVASVVRRSAGGELGAMPTGKPLTPGAARRIFRQIITETRRAEFASVRSKRKKR